MKMKKYLSLLLALALLPNLAACGSEDVSADDTGDGSWGGILVSVRQADLESEGGLPPATCQSCWRWSCRKNVTVVIQTGGAAQWQNDVVEADKLQRFVYNSEGLQLVDEQPSASMGDSETLEEFLRFARENYPADRTAVVFWNHGGGSVSGAAFDELYDYDSLTLDEMYAAFSQVWEPSLERGSSRWSWWALTPA